MLNQEPAFPLIEQVEPLREFMDRFPQASRGVRVTTKISPKQMDDLKAFAARQQALLGSGSRVEVRLQKPGQGAHINRSKAHTQTGVWRTGKPG